MSQSTETLLKRYETSAETCENKGKKLWAYAKNGLGDEYYGMAKKEFAKAEENRMKAAQLKASIDPNSCIKANEFVGDITKSGLAPGAVAGGITVISEVAKSVYNEDSFETTTSNAFSKGLESVVNATAADAAAKTVATIAGIINPTLAGPAYVVTAIATNEVVSEMTDGVFGGIGKRAGEIGGNIGYDVSRNISDASDTAKRVIENIGWAASNTLSDIGSGIKSFFRW